METPDDDHDGNGLCPAVGRHASEEELAELVFAQLEAGHLESAAHGADHGDDSKTSIRGGAWTAELGVPSDHGIRAQACGSEAISWCGKYNLNRTASFAHNLYGDRVAEALASFWCANMQFFYSIYVFMGDDGYA
jgi:hypothetical protein